MIHVLVFSQYEVYFVYHLVFGGWVSACADHIGIFICKVLVQSRTRPPLPAGSGLLQMSRAGGLLSPAASPRLLSLSLSARKSSLIISRAAMTMNCPVCRPLGSERLDG